MALAKERTMRQNSQSPFSQGLDPSSLEFFGFKGHHSSMLEDGTTLFDPSINSNVNVGFMSSFQNEHEQSMINHWAYSSSSTSLLSFDQGDRFAGANYSKFDQEQEKCDLWIDTMDRDDNSLVARDMNCFEMARGGYGEERFMRFQDGGDQEERGSQKRPYMGGGEMMASKKQCGGNRKAKAKPVPSKDPQSIAAKNRRERISERLKVLQDLVPNGTKVDLVTMLEKAISYVKFLQLQVKVLATDEFWPAQGSKAPEVAQVKEAIDAILSSHRDRNSSSK